MTAPSVWADLAHQHEAARNVSHTKVDTLLRDRVKGLVKREHCADRYLGKVTFKKGLRGDKAEIYVAGRDDTAWGEDIPLHDLPDVDEVKLSIHVVLDDRQRRLAKYTIRLSGLYRTTRAPWIASVELDDRRLGAGACGHAIIHCHVGPDHDITPQFRLPCPPLKPWDALDWLLAMVVPGWEPVPWPAVPALPAR